MEHEKLREAACAANVRVWESGLIILTWGNVSVADRDSGVFAIKPSGVPYEDLTPESMVIVGIEDGAPIDGALRPSSDTPTHRVLYQRFDGVGAVVHTHSEAATSFAQASLSIPCMGTTHADHFAGPVPVTRHPSQEEIDGGYEAATGEIIIAHFADHGIDPLVVPGVLLPHHGPFVWGPTAAKAVDNAIALESIARMAGTTSALRPDAPPVPERLAAKHFTRKHGPSAYYGQQ